jgi:hypothetical protein
MGCLRRCVVILATLGALTGCGQDPPPGESVPALARHLDQVDAAIETGDYQRARLALDELVAETAQAEVGGDISDEQADRIVAAVRALLARLPETQDDEAPSPDETGASNDTSEDTTDEGEPDGEGDGDKNDKDKDEDKGSSGGKGSDEKDD